MIGIFLLLMIVTAFLYVRSLLKAKLRKEAWVCGCMLALTAVIGSMVLAGAELPSPVSPMRPLFEPIGRTVLKQ